MTRWIGAFTVATALAAGGGAQNTPAGCADQSHRSAAVVLARAINTAEAAAFRLQRSYQQLEGLPVGPTPAGMTVQLTTDGEAYAFSIKDGDDACHGAVFSDQTGVIYAGAALR